MPKQLPRASVLAALLLLATLLAACGDDDDEGAGETTTTEEVGETESGAADEIDIEMVDYGYDISGPLRRGLVTISTSNAGDEFHMMILARMKSGVTLEQVIEGLNGQFGGDGSGAEESLGEVQLIAAQEDTTSTTATGEQSDEEGDDPFTQFFEEDSTTDVFGQVLQPGQEQSITADLATPGSYALICFIPTEGEGTPHFAKGMINELEVVDEVSELEPPEPDATYTLADGAAPEGPTELDRGKNTIAVEASGDRDNEFAAAMPDGDTTIDDINAFFDTAFESEEGPPEGAAGRFPATIAFSMFAVPTGQTAYVTADFEAGTYLFINTTTGPDEDGDDQVLEVEVT